MAQSNGDGLRKGTGGSFWRRVTMTAGDQADGGDTWHISKKDFNEYLIELDEIILADRKQHELEARISELDRLIDIEDKTFNQWSQKDIAHFFNVVGKRYRSLEAERSQYDSIEQ